MTNTILTKVCRKCKTTKNLSEFYKNKANKDGVFSKCKPCDKMYAKMFQRTKVGLISKIYHHQKETSKRRNHKEPTYTRLELQKWCFNKKNFHVIYDNWVFSNYDKMMRPSCDRTDDYLGYDLSRLKLGTWKDNFDKGHLDRKKGINNKMSKAVVGMNIETGAQIYFHSMNEAGRNGFCFKKISLCCLGKQKSHKNHTWEIGLK